MVPELQPLLVSSEEGPLSLETFGNSSKDTLTVK